MNSRSDGVTDYFEALCNWGRWGADDQFGTLNYIKSRESRRAVQLIQDAQIIGCERPIAAGPIPQSPSQILRLMADTGESAPTEGWGSSSEWIGIRFHGREVTHLDSLAHVFWNGKAYNGREAQMVTAQKGASFGSIDALGGIGLLCRGVLLDIPRSEERDFLVPGEAIMPTQLEMCEIKEKLVVSEGDAVFVRTGRELADASKREAGDRRLAGLDAHCLPWLHERKISILGSDGVNDVAPPAYPELVFPIHAIGITAMGLWLIDNAALELLATECASRNRWEFCLVLAPLNIEGATGSPINPMAIF